jgi:hypothetical protein
MKAQEGINIGVLGMTATKYKEVHGIAEPFNDNLPVTKVHAKNMALIIATSELAEDPRETISNKEGREIGINSGIIASLVLEDKDFRAELKARIASRAKDLNKIFKKKIQSSKSKAG